MNHIEALDKLKRGNARYIERLNSEPTPAVTLQTTPASEGQAPFAILLSCSDSRVPCEFIFDCGLGDLFVVRVAGNIADSTQIGSIEFACQNFGSTLIVVMGHTHCGAIKATIDVMKTKDAEVSPSVASLVNMIEPAVASALDCKQDGELINKATRANIENSIKNLLNESQALKAMCDEDSVNIVGAEYDIESGQVTFL